MVNDKLLKLAIKLGEKLKAEQRVLTLAESCTGGLASAYVTEVAGSSTWFDRGFITYSNASKQDLLNVQNDTLERFGTVSEETAIEMALGALSDGRADIAVAITGIAGPDGGSDSKPVGTVCFAWAGMDLPLITKTLHFTGDRHAIREQSVQTAFEGILEVIQV